MLQSVALNEFYRLINHGPVVLVTSAAEDRANIAPVAWTTPLNDDPALVALPIAEPHFTTELIRRSGEFAINVPGRELLPAIIHAGKSSGRNENKFTTVGLTPQPGIQIKTPHIGECIGFLECRVQDTRSYDGVTVFIARVLYAAAEDACFDGCWIPEKANTLHHLGGGYFALTGRRFKSH
jgi:flavin reductase (DIM6/NTAB) family NADH-FMN oxidoreductase RutF